MCGFLEPHQNNGQGLRDVREIGTYFTNSYRRACRSIQCLQYDHIFPVLTIGPVHPWRSEFVGAWAHLKGAAIQLGARLLAYINVGVFVYHYTLEWKGVE